MYSSKRVKKMAKDDNNGRGQDKSNNKGHRRNERRPMTIASKAILKLGPPPTSKRTTSVKLNDAMESEVKEKNASMIGKTATIDKSSSIC